MLGCKRTSNKTITVIKIFLLIVANPLAHNSCLCAPNCFVFSVLTPYRCTFSHFFPRDFKDNFFDAIAATRLASCSSAGKVTGS